MNRKILISAFILIVFQCFFISCGFKDRSKNSQIVFEGEIKPDFAVSFVEIFDSESLVAAGRNNDRIYFIDRDANIRKTIHLNTLEEIRGIELVEKNKIAVILTSGVYFYNINGVLLDKLLFKEDDKTPLFPSAIYADKDRMYIADEASRAVFAVSLVDIFAQTAQKELVPLTLKFEVLVTFPGIFDIKKAKGLLKQPSSICVSPDGRVFVGDRTLKEIKVYSCSGRYLYNFEKIEGIAPVSIDYDDKPGSVKIPKNVYDPARTDTHGRVHVCDIENSKIHVFSTMGKYLFSYGEGILRKPSDLAVDIGNNLIFVADPSKKSIFVFKYKE